MPLAPYCVYLAVLCLCGCVATGNQLGTLSVGGDHHQHASSQANSKRHALHRCATAACVLQRQTEPAARATDAHQQRHSLQRCATAACALQRHTEPAAHTAKATDALLGEPGAAGEWCGRLLCMHVVRMVFMVHVWFILNDTMHSLSRRFGSTWVHHGGR